ncbi:MAG TPA: DNA primase [Bacteroidetes bacterium]|nr:DNA primase [Bacteroidota bacterium]
MIPDHIKEQVKSTADIVEVVSDHVKLKRSGNGFTGLCPFHNEKSPSFHVSPHLGIYKCFGCGESGDVFSFVMKMDGVSFIDAIRQLGQRFDVDVPEEERPEQDEQYKLKEGIFHALAFAGKYFHNQLMKSPQGQQALSYLEERGMLRGTIRSYGLGYAPDRFDGLINAAKEASINEEYLHEAGLIKYSRNGESAFDAFRHRLMFPIFNAAGRVIGFGGRVLAGADGKTPKNVAKYINTSQTKVYNKSEVLYGIHAAKNEIRKHSEVILVEGYTDVLSMHQAEVKNVVATSGTALTTEQLKILHRYTENLLMIYDADQAGQNAMSRGVELALSEGLNVRLLKLPEGEDPDSFIQKQKKQGFLEFKDAHALDFVSFSIKKARDAKQWEDPIHKKNTVATILSSIARIPDEITRETYIQRLSELANLGTRALFEELNVQLMSHARDVERNRKADQRTDLRNYQQSQSQKDQNKVDVKKESGQNSRSAKSDESEISTQSFQDGPPEYFKDDAYPSGNWPEDDSFRGNGNHDDSFQSFQNAKKNETVKSKPSFDTKKRPAYERGLLRLMLHHMHPMVEYIGSQCNEEHFEDADYRLLFADLIHRYHEGDPISVSVYMEREEPYPALVGEIVFDRYSTSDRVKEKLGKKIDRDGNPYRTAKGELRSLKIHYLDRVKTQLQNEYSTAKSQKDKKDWQEKLLEVSRLRLQFETQNLDDLFPNPEDI